MPDVTLREVTLRDYFAGKALQALITKNPAKSCFRHEIEAMNEHRQALVDYAHSAYDFADAMLEARERINA